MKTAFSRFIVVILYSILATSILTAQEVQDRKKIELFAQPVTEKKDLQGPSYRTRENNTRGYCYAYFDNFTGHFVDLWIEGIYQGRIAPYATSVRIDIWVPGNWAKWYMETTDKKQCWRK